MRTVYEQRKAMGTSVMLALVVDDTEESAHELMRQLWLEVFLFEKRCSRFLPNSELSQFNRAAGVSQHVTPEFRAVLLAAKRMGQQTGGLYNPFVLPVLQRAGYVRSLVAEYAHDPVDDHSARSLVSVDKLVIDDDQVSIPYGTAIDLGGCGKGYIGDFLADMVRNHQGLQGFWFSIGGDVVTCGLDEQGQPWRVTVAPSISDASAAVAEIPMPDDGRYGVATSTTALRRGTKAGKAWHHIIDPRSGQPASTNVELAAVWTGSLLEADVLASCAIILGDATATDFLDKQHIRAALLGVRPDTSETAVYRAHGEGIIMNAGKSANGARQHV